MAEKIKIQCQSCGSTYKVGHSFLHKLANEDCIKCNGKLVIHEDQIIVWLQPEKGEIEWDFE